ncbi:MAG: hypothetical protein GEU83_01735 [Pseudonocardiaceae bacterium]|nr:hypothetical protein [Pseudonocardiaceae bacterium]
MESEARGGEAAQPPRGGHAAQQTHRHARPRQRTADRELQMLAYSDGGDAHSVDDYCRWLAETGYGPTQIHDLDSPPQTIVLAER